MQQENFSPDNSQKQEIKFTPLFKRINTGEGVIIRPIDIARKFGLSTTTIRKYETIGLMPPVPRSPTGYRSYTKEHTAYIACVREMAPAFTLLETARILKAVMAGNMDKAFWKINQKQARLQRDKQVLEKTAQTLLHSKTDSLPETQRLSIHEVSRITGVPATAIRYWDNVGLLRVTRSAENNYRMFTPAHIQQVLTVYTLKLSVYAEHKEYSIAQMRAALSSFDYKDKDKISALIAAVDEHLCVRNREQMRAAAALYHLCLEVETGDFSKRIFLGRLASRCFWNPAAFIRLNK